jgi:hypothetical protein
LTSFNVFHVKFVLRPKTTYKNCTGSPYDDSCEDGRINHQTYRENIREKNENNNNQIIFIFVQN